RAINRRRNRVRLCPNEAALCAFVILKGVSDMKKLMLSLAALMMMGVGFAAYSMQATTASAPQSATDLQEKIRMLSSANPVERASAACQIGEMGKQATAAIPHLVALLGDDTPVNARLDCSQHNNMMGKHNYVEHTTPAQHAAAALAAMGSAAVEPLIGVL